MTNVRCMKEKESCFIKHARKTPYIAIREVARLCCRCQHDTKSIVVGSIHVAL